MNRFALVLLPLMFGLASTAANQCCNFDDVPGSGECGFLQQGIDGTNDEYDFIIQAGSTSSSNTGPSTANGDKYAYLETSSPKVPGETAQLVITPVTESFTLDFDYHMYGASMGSARVFETDGSGVTTDLWNKSGDQGDQWYTDQVTVSASAVSVTIEATVGASFTSDIAFDNICMATNDVAEPECPAGFVELGSNCYQIVPDAGLTWAQALTACANGSLLIVDSEAELTLIRDYIRADPALGYRKKYWTAGTETPPASGNWTWMDSNAVAVGAINNLFWGQGEPNNKAGDEYCLNLLWLRQYLYNDARCSKRFGYICKTQPA